VFVPDTQKGGKGATHRDGGRAILTDARRETAAGAMARICYRTKNEVRTGNRTAGSASTCEGGVEEGGSERTKVEGSKPSWGQGLPGGGDGERESRSGRESYYAEGSVIPKLSRRKRGTTRGAIERHPGNGRSVYFLKEDERTDGVVGGGSGRRGGVYEAGGSLGTSIPQH